MPATGSRMASTSRGPPERRVKSRSGPDHCPASCSTGLRPEARRRAVTCPVSSCSRRISATASALAAKATTMPVMTIACGTGSKAKPRRRAPARDNAEHQEHAAADQVEGENFAQGLRVDDQAIKAEADQRGADQPGKRRRAHGSGLRRGGPATSIGKVDRDGQQHEGLDEQDDRLGETGRIGEEIFRPCASPARPATRNTAGTRDQRQPQPARVDARRLGNPRDHHDHPHRRENGAALKGAAGLIRADPENVDADEDAERRPGSGRETPARRADRRGPAAPGPRPRTGRARPTRRRPPPAAARSFPAWCRRSDRRSARR